LCRRPILPREATGCQLVFIANPLAAGAAGVEVLLPERQILHRGVQAAAADRLHVGHVDQETASLPGPIGHRPPRDDPRAVVPEHRVLHAERGEERLLDGFP
jgi:hypothetical protein